MPKGTLITAEHGLWPDPIALGSGNARLFVFKEPYGSASTIPRIQATLVKS
jgi:hypothetical protein